MADPSSLAHRPQLDTVRWLAFLAVFCFHGDENLFPYGALGVPLFFVLSGFLITRLLLLNETGALGHDLGVFYLRRTLRIFPLYYLVLTILLVLGMLPAAWWYFLYLHNVYIFLNHVWTGQTNHFWSLCVEEQFYLLYPLLLLLTPPRGRAVLLSILLVGSILTRITLARLYPGSKAWALLPVSGEYILWGCVAGMLELRLAAGTLTPLLFLGPLIHALTALDQYFFHGLSSLGLSMLYQTSHGIGFSLMLLALWRLPPGGLLDLFCFPPTVYLGRISYGLYVFHNFTYGTKARLVEWLPAVRFIPGPAIALLTTIALAMLSWHLFESPINRLKQRFPYRG